MAEKFEPMVSRADERAKSLAKVAASEAERVALAAQGDAELIAGIKARAAAADAKGAPESLGRCQSDGEATGAQHNIAPVEGSVRENDNGTGWMGTCPLCGTFAKLHTRRKVMLVHVMRRETLPASPALSEPGIEPTDSGARTGDPLAGSKRRADAIDGAFERGMVSLTVMEAGKRKRVDVPATLENLQAALQQELRRNLKSAASIKERDALVASLRRRIDGALAGKKVLNAPSAEAVAGISAVIGRSDTAKRTAGQRGEGRTDGPAMVQGPNMAPVQPTSGYIGKAGTMSMPLGRSRVDAGALGVAVTDHDKKLERCAEGACDHIAGGTAGHLTYAEVRALSRSQNRHYWAHVKKVRERGKRSRAYSASLPRVQRNSNRVTGKGAVKSDTERLMARGN